MVDEKIYNIVLTDLYENRERHNFSVRLHVHTILKSYKNSNILETEVDAYMLKLRYENIFDIKNGYVYINSNKILQFLRKYKLDIIYG